MAIKEAAIGLAADAIFTGANIYAIIAQGSWSELNSTKAAIIASEVPIGIARSQLIEASRVFDAVGNTMTVVLDNTASLFQPANNVISDRFALMRGARSIGACAIANIAGADFTVTLNGGATLDWQIGDEVAFNDQQTATITGIAGAVVTVDVAPSGTPTSISNMQGELLQAKIVSAKTFLSSVTNTIEDEVVLSGV